MCRGGHLSGRDSSSGALGLFIVTLGRDPRGSERCGDVVWVAPSWSLYFPVLWLCWSYMLAATPSDVDAVTSCSGRCRERLTRVPCQSVVALALQPGVPRTSALCRKGSDLRGGPCSGETALSRAAKQMRPVACVWSWSRSRPRLVAVHGEVPSLGVWRFIRRWTHRRLRDVLEGVLIGMETRCVIKSQFETFFKKNSFLDLPSFFLESKISQNIPESFWFACSSLVDSPSYLYFSNHQRTWGKIKNFLEDIF